MNLRGFSRSFFSSNWTVGLICLGFELVLWSAVYSLLPLLYARLKEGDGNFDGSVAAIQFAVVVGCLFIVGGYDGRTRFMSLNYMSEHFLAVLTAGCLGGLCIYAGTTFNLSIHPSRGILLGQGAVRERGWGWRRRQCQPLSPVEKAGGSPITVQVFRRAVHPAPA